MWSLQTRDLGKSYKAHRRPVDGLKEALLRRDLSPADWVVRGVGFDLRSGGSLGIVGDNGAGKSTLLRLLAGIITPTEGLVRRQGKVATMLQLGTGFHPDLTGLENIRMGCAVMGLSPAETAALMPGIIDFAELGEYMQRPMRTYSSGMNLRLSFSVAVARQPDLLIVDEHLSVGDQHFRYKCLKRIMALRAAGCALVLCSHELHALRELCERTLWLKQGRPHLLGETVAVLNAYESEVRTRQQASLRPSGVDEQADPQRPHPADNWIDDVSLDGDDGVVLGRDGPALLPHGGRLRIRIRLRVTEQAWQDKLNVGVLVKRNDGLWCHGVSTRDDAATHCMTPLGDGAYGLLYTIERLPLLAGHYSLTVALLDHGSPMVYDQAADVCPFEVTQDCLDRGLLRIDHRWSPWA